MTASRRATGVESARKALQMLLWFDENHTEARVPDLAAAAGVPTSTAYRYVALLREMGLLEDGTRGRYHVSPRVYGLTRAADTAGGLVLRARPFMKRLAADTGETVVLVRLLGDIALAVDQMETDPPTRLAYAPGRTMPLTAGAPAKMLLASLPATTREAFLDRLAAQDPDFARRRPAWESELIRVRRQDWAESSHEVDPGFWGVSAPIRHVPAGGRQQGTVIAALSVAGPMDRLDPAARTRIIALCCRAAADITGALAGGGQKTTLAKRTRAAARGGGETA